MSDEGIEQSVREKLVLDGLNSAWRKMGMQYVVCAYLVYAGWVADRVLLGVMAGGLASLGVSLRARIAYTYKDKSSVSAEEMKQAIKWFELCVFITGLGWIVASLGIFPVMVEKGEGQLYISVAIGALAMSVLWTSPVGKAFPIYLACQIGSLVLASLLGPSQNVPMAVFLLMLGATLMTGSIKQKELYATRTAMSVREQAMQSMAEQEALRRAKEAAERAERLALDRQRILVGKVSHEIRTPVQIISTVLESVEMQGTLTEKNKKRLEAAVNALLSEMRQLSEYVQADFVAGGREETVDLGKVIGELLVMQQSQCEAKGLTLRSTVPDVQLEVNALGVRQCVQNLLTNAVRYTEEGWVELRCSVQEGEGGQWLQVEVEDSGKGLVGVDASLLFEPFYRGSGKKANEGMGLGLSIVKSVTERMGGTISIANKQPSGGCLAVWRVPAKTIAPA